MGAHERMSREAGGALGSVPVRGDRPAVGEFFLGRHPEVCCGVAILGGAFFLNDFSLFLFLKLWLLSNLFVRIMAICSPF